MATPRIDLNPSSADRWVTCTASPRFIMANADKLPPSDTVYNQEGTTAHEVAAALLQNREPDPKECPTPVTGEMRRHAWDYMEYVMGLVGPSDRANHPLGSDILVEQKLPLWYSPGRNGKIDVAVRAPGHFHVVDYKYGQGVIVDPFENLQGAIYARLCYKFITAQQRVNGSLEGAPVSIHIYQPRGRGAEDSPFHVWDTTWDNILRLTQQVTDAAELILSNGDTEFKPSEKACRFCPAKGFCTARTKEFTAELTVLPPVKAGPIDLPPANIISDEQLVALVKHRATIESWLKDGYDFVSEQMVAGRKFEGLKLVRGRQGNRYWTNLEAAAQLLLKETHLRADEVFETSVISPGGAEKLLGKKALTLDLLNLINRSEGKPTIAPVGDKRPVYGGIDAAKEFAELEGGTDL